MTGGCCSKGCEDVVLVGCIGLVVENRVVDAIFCRILMRHFFSTADRNFLWTLFYDNVQGMSEVRLTSRIKSVKKSGSYDLYIMR